MVAEAVHLLVSGDPVLRARSADALEKSSREGPAVLHRHKNTLLRLAAQSRQQEVRWHLAQMLPRLRLTPSERRRAIQILRAYLRDSSRIVQVFAMQALWELDPKDPWVCALVKRMAVNGSPSARARARRLLREKSPNNEVQLTKSAHGEAERGRRK